jgi:hypothetical protein
MTIEHIHFDTRKDNHNDGTWTMKIKRTFTKYPEESSIIEHDKEAFGQVVTTISNNNMITDDAVANEPIQDSASIPDHTFIAGVRVEAEPTLTSNDISEEAEPSYGDLLYEQREGKRTESRDYSQNRRDEEETVMTAERRRDVMWRYPRSRFIMHYSTEHENYHKGYRFYSGVSPLISKYLRLFGIAWYLGCSNALHGSNTWYGRLHPFHPQMRNYYWFS